MELLDMLRLLCAAPGVSGAEDTALEAVNACAADAGLKFEKAERGPCNLIAVLNPEADGGVRVTAHVDKIGMVVTAVDAATGFLKVANAGGTDARTAPAGRVTVYGKRALPGVIVSTPPHLLPPDAAKKALPPEKLAVDCGYKYEEIRTLVSPGDRVQACAPVLELSEHVAAGPFMDNSAGVAVALKAAELIKGRTERRVEIVLTAQEETGIRGAVTAAFSPAGLPTVALDTTFAAAPGMPDDCAAMGSGARIGVSPILDRALSDRLTALAEENGIPYTVEVMGRSTGTDADRIGIAAGGCAAGLLSVPIRNMHTPVETLDLRDAEAAAQLLAEWMVRG